MQHPKNSPVYPLARSIPQYRQAKLAGEKYAGPIKNILPTWSQAKTASSPILSDDKNRPIKGQQTIDTQTGQLVKHAPPTPPPQPTADSSSPTPPAQQAEPPASPPKSAPPDPTVQEAKKTLNQQSTQLGQRLQAKETELNKLKQKTVQQQEQLKKLFNQRKTAETIIKNLKQQFENLESQELIEEAEVNTYKEKIASKESEIEDLHQEIDMLKRNLEAESELEQQIKSYRNQIETLTQQQNKLEEMVQQSETRMQMLNSKLEEEKQAKIQKDTQIKRLEKLLDETIRSSLSPPQPAQNVVSAEENVAQELPVITKHPNAISGVVVDKKGKLITDAVVLIKNVAGQNLRALKTNQLGQFVATTPLPNGKYFVETSKPGFSFDIIEVNLTGGVVPPVEVRSHELAA